MSDSVDRVFVHALATVRRLPRTGSSRPPPSARLQLYGLYKQSMEGDVFTILSRPTLPPPSPDPSHAPSNLSNNSVHRYASRDLRTREAQSEIEKWDAWHACAGMSRTEAKRRYITTLIDTMKEYASGTAESRELVSELEFVWNQIRSQNGSDESEEGESPTRKLERAGMKQMTTSSAGRDDSNTRRDQGSNSMLGRIASETSGSRPQKPSRSQSGNNTNSQGLRVLSPISQRSSDGVVENEEIQDRQPEEDEDEDAYASASEDRPTTTQPQRHSHHQQSPRPPTTDDPQEWRSQIESSLRHLTTELAALREQLSTSNLLSRSYFSHPLPPNSPLRKRILHRTSIWIRWLFWAGLRQLAIQLGLLVIVLIWERWRGNRSIERWMKGRLKTLLGGMGRRWFGIVGVDVKNPSNRHEP